MKFVELSALDLLNGIPDAPPVTLAIGDFDGVHRGHQSVLRTATETANLTDTRPAVMIFHPHPRVVLGLGAYEHLLTPLQHRVQLFARSGMETTYLVTFDRSFSEWPPEQFSRCLHETLNVRQVVVGFDFTYGFKGLGNVETLQADAGGRFGVQVVSPYEMDGEKVSSTRIRSLLNDGAVADAKACLGRAYSVRGTVVSGDARGRTIGFPTANVLPAEPYFLPRHGVYVAQMRIWNGSSFSEESMPAVMNVGKRPTFEGLPDIRIEVHLLDRSMDLYGKRVEVEWLSWIRAEQRFADADALVRQIRLDAETARAFFQ